MFSKRITAALFAIAIASSLIVVSGDLLGSAFAAKKGRDSAEITNTIVDPNGTDKSSSPKSQSTNAGESSPTAGASSNISGKDLKSLSKCQSDAAKDGDLTLTEVNDCYGQVLDQGGQGQGTDQSSSAGGNDRSTGGQGQQQQKSSSFNGQNVGTMREGFPF
jgi:hypothetical protein